MAHKGMSLHIGLNSVDPKEYEGWDGKLNACEQDARDMKAIAESKGCKATMLLTAQATSSNVMGAIEAAAATLAADDLFILTYSGHGGQIEDSNADEGDDLDETWVLYNRQLIDDELYTMFSLFNAGVRILMFSDSCHSGTVARFVPDFLMASPGVSRAYGLPDSPRYRFMPPEVSARTYNAHKELYDELERKYRTGGDHLPIGASVQLISGCQDNQLSLDGPRNGLFTSKVLQVWNNGSFKGTYRKFWREISAKMPPTQSPNLFRTGMRDIRFERQTPFTV